MHVGVYISVSFRASTAKTAFISDYLFSLAKRLFPVPNWEQRHTGAYLWLCTFHWEALPVSCHQSEQNQPRSSQSHRSLSPGLERISRIFNLDTLVSTITDDWRSPLNTSETQSLKGLSVDLWGGLKASRGQENRKPKEEETSGKNNKKTMYTARNAVTHIFKVLWYWMNLTHWRSAH